MNYLFGAEEFPVADAFVFILTGLIGGSIAVFQLFSKKPEIVKKRNTFILTLAMSLAALAVGAYLLFTGKTIR